MYAVVPVKILFTLLKVNLGTDHVEIFHALSVTSNFRLYVHLSIFISVTHVLPGVTSQDVIRVVQL
jgi:hypothetical protein